MIVYLIRNLVNYKVYVGQATSLHDRWLGHLSAARIWKRTKKNLPEILLVDRAIAKYGEKNFEVIELCEATSKQNLDELESFCISLFNSTDLEVGYNLRSGGKNGSHHQSSKKKQSQTLRARGMTFRWITNGVDSIRVEKTSPMPNGWRCGRVVEWTKGKKSPVHIAKFVESRRNGKGWRHTQEVRDRMSRARKGKKHKPEVEEKRLKAVRLALFLSRRSHLKICYICFKPFDSCSNPEGVTCSRKCHYKMDSIMTELGHPLASIYWEKLTPEERITDMRKRHKNRRRRKTR
jgi:group I intron endonuclease